MHLAIRADGGPEIGYGHLVRSGALAEEFSSRGHTVTFATTTPDDVQQIALDNIETIELSKRSDPDPFVAWLDTARPDVVFTDSYVIGTDYQRNLRQRVPLAVLQDDDRHDICADLFVNGNLYADSLNYTYIGPRPKTCLGPEYVLLRQKIRKLTMREPPWRRVPKYALVTMGGSDVREITPSAVRAFDGFDIQVDVIIGPGFSKKQESAVRVASAETAVDTCVVRNPEDLPKRMFRADFAVCTASTTTYELLALGTPMVCVPVVENQIKVAEALRNHDAATVLDSSSQSVLDDAIKKCMVNPEVRKNCRERGRALIDSKGTERVTRQLLSLGRRT